MTIEAAHFGAGVSSVCSVSSVSDWRLAWRRKGPVFSLPAAAVLAVLWNGDVALAQQCTTTGTNQTCTNSIFLTGGADGIFDNATLTVTNTASGTITGSVFGINATDTANVTNFGTIKGGVFGINATNAANIINYGTISGGISISASASNVTNNFGTISGSIFGISANTATISNSGSIFGGTFGIFATTATVTNSGSILVAAGGRDINATATATVTNSGIISGGAVGVSANNIANVSNSGTLSGSNLGINAASGAVTNSGSISGVTGINFGGNSNVFNSGTITGTGGTAINFVAGLNTLTLGPGFVINGKVIGAGTDTLQLGGTGNGIFDLSLIGATQQYEGFSTFNKVGSSTWTVTGTFSQPGPWAVQSGTFVVNGDLSAASGIMVDSGATLGGTGTLSGTTVNDGATLAPGPLNSIGTLHVIGNLVLASAASYVVQVSPVAASLTTISGTASIGGTLVANGSGGVYTVGRKYAVLTASGGVAGTFSSLTVMGSFGATRPTITYDADDAYLVLAPALLPLPPGAPTNVTNVANAIDAANTGTLPLAFQSLFSLPPQQLQNALTELSGEAGTGAQQGAFQITGEFLSLLVDPFGNDRADVAKAPAPASPMRLKAPRMLAAPAPRLSVWGAAYGSTNSTNGDPEGLGSHDLTAHTSGFAAGVDDRIAPDTTVGFALAGGATSWGLSQGLGGGRTDVFQAGVYGSRQFGPAYLSGALAYGSHWASTSRSVGGSDQLNASFNAQSFGGRLEGGYRIIAIPFGLTPYAALQAQNFFTPGYSESAAAGVSPFALGFSARTATGVRGEIGGRAEKAFAIASGTEFHLMGRIGWAHDWQNNPQLGATFLSVPAASFVVNGAVPPTDLLLMSNGAEWRWRNGWSFLAKFDGELARGSQTYAGTARLRYAW
jgi:outer membrane autotransporter protein